jgi:hypothetical protein
MVLQKKHLLLTNNTYGTLIIYNLYMGKPTMVFLVGGKKYNLVEAGVIFGGGVELLSSSVDP